MGCARTLARRLPISVFTRIYYIWHSSIVRNVFLFFFLASKCLLAMFRFVAKVQAFKQLCYQVTKTHVHTLINDNSLGQAKAREGEKYKRIRTETRQFDLFVCRDFFAHFMANLWHQQIREKRAGAGAKICMQIERQMRISN